MHRHVLAEHVVVANPQPGWLPVVLQVLRRLADHAAGVEPVVRADGRQTRQIDLRADDTVRADLHAFINDRVRPHSDRGVQLRLGMNNGGWMNHLSPKWGNRPRCQVKTSKHPCSITYHVSRITSHAPASRITHHASRITFHV